MVMNTMGKLPSILLSVFLGAATACHALDLAHDGETVYQIVLPNDAIAAECTAATELADHLRQMTGATFPIVSEGQFRKGKMIAVGFNGSLPSSLRPERYGQLGPEELVIDSYGDTLLLSGGRPRGALYAVYEFLDLQGVMWLTPEVTHIPKRRNYAPAVRPYRYSSPFEYRTQVAGNGETPAWCARNRLNSYKQWRHPGEEYGGGVYQGPSMETFWYYFRGGELRTHPDWLAEVQGKREPYSNSRSFGLCLSNPAVRNFLIEHALSWAKSNLKASAVWLAQNDASPYCTCERCRAFYAAHGGQPSSLIVQLLNELAVRLKQVVPGMQVKTLAYSWSLTPPKHMSLEDNVVVMLCASMDHRATIGRDERSAKFLADYRGWQALTKNFEVYLYGYPFTDYFSPCPCLYAQGRNIQWAAQNGIRQLHHQIFGFADSRGGDLVYLRVWLYTQLAWNPKRDIDILIERFCRAYYGEEAAPVLLKALKSYHEPVERESRRSSMRPSDVILEFSDAAISGRQSLPFVPDYVEVDQLSGICRELESCLNRLSDSTLKRRFAYAMLPMMWGYYWSGFKGLCVHDLDKGVWGAALEDRERRIRYGKMIRSIMMTEGITRLAERKVFNSKDLVLDLLATEHVAVELRNEELSVVSVPSCYGKTIAMKLRKTGFNPLKQAWGHVILQYPTFGYWRDFINSAYVPRYNVLERRADYLKMQGRRHDGIAIKTLKIEGDVIRQSWAFSPRQAQSCTMQICPLFNLDAVSLGTYPVLDIGLKQGGWRTVFIGKLNFFWYQDGFLDLCDFNGTLRLTSEDRCRSVTMQMNPEQVKDVVFIYDRYKCKPAGTDGILELKIGTKATKVAAGRTYDFAIDMKLEEKAKSK